MDNWNSYIGEQVYDAITENINGVVTDINREDNKIYLVIDDSFEVDSTEYEHVIDLTNAKHYLRKKGK